MVVLAIDTSGKQGGITLAQCAADGCRILESSPIAGGTFSAQLVPQIAESLSKHSLESADLGLLVAISGPGSFTGLRVGLAAIKGLAEVLEIPIVAVSLLELMAVSSGQSGRILALLDAGRSECYCGEYEVRDGSAMLIRECLITREEAVGLASRGGWNVITSDEIIASSLRDRAIVFVEIARPGSEAAVQAGYQRYLAGQTVTLEALDANYIRRSDAEIFSKPKLDARKRGT
jgi:tRNA threonylcarbamoyladenosine biosynthesis protein TsaB